MLQAATMFSVYYSPKIPQEILALEDALVNKNMSLVSAEKYAQHYKEDFKISDWLSGEKYPTKWYGNRPFGEQLEAKINNIKTNTALDRWEAGDAELGAQISKQTETEFLDNYMYRVEQFSNPYGDTLGKYAEDDLLAMTEMGYQAQRPREEMTEFDRDMARQDADIAHENLASEVEMQEIIGTEVRDPIRSTTYADDDAFGAFVEETPLEEYERGVADDAADWRQVYDQIDVINERTKNIVERMKPGEGAEEWQKNRYDNMAREAYELEITPEMGAAERLDVAMQRYEMVTDLFKEEVQDKWNKIDEREDFQDLVEEFNETGSTINKAREMTDQELDELLDSIKVAGPHPQPEGQKLANDIVDDITRNQPEWQSVDTDIALQGLGEKGIINDIHSAFGSDLANAPLEFQRSTMMREMYDEFEDLEEKAENVEDLEDIENFRDEMAARDEVTQEMLEEFDEMAENWEMPDFIEGGGQGDIEMQELAEPEYEEYDDLAAEPLGNQPLNRIGQVEYDRMAGEVMSNFLGLVAGELGKGGLLATPDTEQQKLDQEKLDAYNDRRKTRMHEAYATWHDTPVYVNIANRWYQGTVRDILVGDISDPTTRMRVEVSWDDKDGDTMNFTVPADANRIRLASDGAPPLREGGITRYEPFTSPMADAHYRGLDDILPTEQIWDGERWREVKSNFGRVFHFSDGETWIAPQAPGGLETQVFWRARGRIHTKEWPKTPKWDPLRAWLDMHPEGKLIPNPKQELYDRLAKMSDEHTKMIKSVKETIRYLQRNPYFAVGDDRLRDAVIRGLNGDDLEELQQLEDRMYASIDRNQWGDGQTERELEDDPDDTEPEEPEEPEKTQDIPDDDEPPQDIPTDKPTDQPPQPTDEDEPPQDIPDEDEPTDQPPDTVDPDDGKWKPPTVPDKPPTTQTDINQHTGHPQVPHDEGVMTENTVRHIAETGGFRGLEIGLGLSMPEIYERYALGRFSWQTDTTIPEWLQPNLTSIYGGADKYSQLIEKYEHDPEMMRRLERVETATRAPYVMNYLDDTHGEMHSIFHDGGISHDDMAHITGQKMPDFAYNSAGHVVLRDDRTIAHDPGSNIHIVNYVAPSGHVSHHTQMDFGVTPET